MSPATFAQLAATSAALALSVRRREARAAGVYLSVRSAASLSRVALVAIVLGPARARMRAAGLEPAAVPFTEAHALVAVYAEGALYLLGGPAALAGLSAALFARRPRLWLACVAAVWALASAALMLAYPAARGAVLARVYLGANLAAVAVSLAAVVPWACERRSPTVAHGVSFLALATSLAEVLSPDGGWVLGDPFRASSATDARSLFYVVSLCLLSLEVWSSCTSPSSPPPSP